jgi:hypothetical protein
MKKTNLYLINNALRIIFSVFILSMLYLTTFAQADLFITTWRVGAGESIHFPAGNSATYNYEIDWDYNGTFVADETGVTGFMDSPVYPTAGDHVVAVRGTYPSFKVSFYAGAISQLIAINQWGTTQWETFEEAFMFCENAVAFVATDAPDLSSCTSMESMFRDCPLFNEDMNTWNTSNISNMQFMFWGATEFNGNITSWDVSNVTQMSLMFTSSSFNQPIGGWDVSSLEEAAWIFQHSPFNQPLNNWNVANLQHASGMFFNSNFNQNIGDWNLSSIQFFNNLFDQTPMSTANYDNTLIGWSNNVNTPSGLDFGADGLTYCAATTERDFLDNTKGWTFNGDASANLSASVSAHPINETVSVNNNASFSVTTTNTDNYQWQEDQGSGFQNITNGGIYGGATTSTLTLTGVTLGMNGYKYRCVLTGCPGTTNSNEATLNVVIIPDTKLRNADCGLTLGSMTQWVYADIVSGAEAYQFRFNDGSGSFTYIRSDGVQKIRLSWINSIDAGTTYDVDVRARVSGVWGSYATVCQLTTPTQLTTQLTSAYCNNTTMAGSYVYCNIVAGADRYQFRFEEQGNPSNVFNKTSTTQKIKPIWITGIQNTTYNVTCRARVGGNWINYGSVCTLTITGAPMRPIIMAHRNSEPISEIETAPEPFIYPNPNNGQFQLRLNQLPESPYQVTVYNALGQMVYNQQHNEQTISLDLKGVEQGFYFVRTTIGERQSVVKMIIR